jgi:hypothetical protein
MRQFLDILKIIVTKPRGLRWGLPYLYVYERWFAQGF